MSESKHIEPILEELKEAVRRASGGQVQEFRGACSADIERASSILLDSQVELLAPIWQAIGGDCQVIPGPNKLLDLDATLFFLDNPCFRPPEVQLGHWPVAAPDYRPTLLCLSQDGVVVEVPRPAFKMPSVDHRPQNIRTVEGLFRSAISTIDQGLEVWDPDHEMFLPRVRPPGPVRQVLNQRFGDQGGEVWGSFVSSCIDAVARHGSMVSPGMFSIRAATGRVELQAPQTDEGVRVFLANDPAEHQRYLRVLAPLLPVRGGTGSVLWPGIGVFQYIGEMDLVAGSPARSLLLELRRRRHDIDRGNE